MTPELAAACERAMHVLCADGRLLRAGRASLYILSGLGWPRIAMFFSLPPMIWFVELGYQIVVSNRVLFDRLLFPR
jgi:predicted DCC family thiol-disulfide oxidoreductase YuxK